MTKPRKVLSTFRVRPGIKKVGERHRGSQPPAYIRQNGLMYKIPKGFAYVELGYEKDGKTSNVIWECRKIVKVKDV